MKETDFMDVVENFHAPTTDFVEEPAEQVVDEPKIFTVARFRPATDRLLLKRLPKPKEGLIIAPQIAEEQSEYGFVVAVGNGVDVPVGIVAKFSKYSGEEEIHFEDELQGDEYLLAYKHDIRGWFVDPDADPLPTAVPTPPWPSDAQVEEALRECAVN
jgi:co-chaperonin GroES (HSP10)